MSFVRCHGNKIVAMRDFAYGEYRQIIAMEGENWSHGLKVIAMEKRCCHENWVSTSGG